MSKMYHPSTPVANRVREGHFGEAILPPVGVLSGPVYVYDAAIRIWHWVTALCIVALAITGAMAWWLARAPSRLVAAALGLVIGGALGNVVDRMRFGAVFDFVDLHAAGWHWPAFNVADAAIVAGAGLLLLDALFAPKPSGK